MTASQSDGVLVVDKPVGPSSHDIVAQARRLFETRQVGHAGTLDPLASGVLLLLLGEATKLNPYLSADNKRYRATVSLGRSTDTLDAAGVVVEERILTPGWLESGELQRALEIERRRTEQLPPSFSAIKVGGERAHRASRRGQPVELGPRSVAVESIELVSADEAALCLEIWVSKGYYVRALARDLGQSLGVPAHLSALRRLASGPFLLGEACPWPPEKRPQPMPIVAAVKRCMPVLLLTASGERRARFGQSLESSDFVGDAGTVHATARQGHVAWLSSDGHLLAIGRSSDPSLYRVVRGFRT